MRENPGGGLQIEFLDWGAVGYGWSLGWAECVVGQTGAGAHGQSFLNISKFELGSEVSSEPSKVFE